MKHAGANALEILKELLESLRSRASLIERRPGVFYVKGKAFLHFHEDPAGLFADLRQDGDWRRLPVNSVNERAMLLALVEKQDDNRPLRHRRLPSGRGTPL
jgi:hypothetical protein